MAKTEGTVRSEWCPYCDARRITFERERLISHPVKYPDKVVVCRTCGNELRIIPGKAKPGVVRINLDTENK